MNAFPNSPVAALFLLFSFVLFSCEVEEDSDYSLTKYHVDMIVNENNTFNISERISAQYHVDRHGIIRKIPLQNNVVRLDGTKSHNRAKITDVRVKGGPYEENISDGKKEIKIGDPDIYITGNKDYEISYLYDIGNDPLNDCDELYFNLIGNEWDTSIDSITFSITMPKDFDASTLGFSSGVFGSTNNDNISYEVNGQVISGSYNGTLKAGEGLTMRMTLPEGYFAGSAGFYSETMVKLSFILPVCFLIIALAMWYIYGKDEKVIVPVNFYPPKGYNSAEIGFLYKGKADTDDVVSLLFYLAAKGYVKITEASGKMVFSKVKDYTITKLKDYDGNNPNERLFLTGLFQKATMTEVTLRDLKNNFYITLDAIISNMNKKENRQTIFEKNSLNKRFPVVIMIITAFLLITAQPMIDYHGDPYFLFILLLPAGGFLMVFLALFTNSFKNVTVNGVPTTSRFAGKSIALIFGLLIGGIFFVLGVLPALLAETVYWQAFLPGIICVVTMLFLNKNMKKRTPLGNELLGKIKGFKRFLETTEKHRLEQMVGQSPDYFYKILPFTYVLGISNVWIKNFEHITIRPPEWYSGDTVFDHDSLGRFINSAMRSATAAMASKPSDSDYGSSGGGSSGGGSGGGGGSSW